MVPNEQMLLLPIKFLVVESSIVFLLWELSDLY